MGLRFPMPNIKAQTLSEDLVGKDTGSLAEVDTLSGAACSTQADLYAVDHAFDKTALVEDNQREIM